MVQRVIEGIGHPVGLAELSHRWEDHRADLLVQLREDDVLVHRGAGHPRRNPLL